jgi:dTMP kinase
MILQGVNVTRDHLHTVNRILAGKRVQPIDIVRALQRLGYDEPAAICATKGILLRNDKAGKIALTRTGWHAMPAGQERAKFPSRLQWLIDLDNALFVAKGGDTSLDRRIARVFFLKVDTAIPAFTASSEAAQLLVEEHLPHWHFNVIEGAGEYRVNLRGQLHTLPYRGGFLGRFSRPITYLPEPDHLLPAPTLALAFCRALVRGALAHERYDLLDDKGGYNAFEGYDFRPHLLDWKGFSGNLPALPDRAEAVADDADIALPMGIVLANNNGQIRASNRGFFITLEGGEGVGKSTQADILAQALTFSGREVVLTREPGGTPLGEQFRGKLVAGEFKHMGAASEALGFAGARLLHMSGKILPTLDRGGIVVCDRFYDSTRAYQGAQGGADPVLLTGLEIAATGGRPPDLTLILDMPVELAMARASSRRQGDSPDRFEADDLELQERRRQGFLEIARNNPDRCIVIDCTALGQLETSKAIFSIVRQRLFPDAVAVV